MQDDKQYVIAYSISKDSLGFESNKQYLIVLYDAKEKDECDLLFRVFFALDSNKINYEVKSDNYIGSYSISPICKDKFRIPISSKISNINSYSILRFYILTLDINGNELKKNLRDNFTFRIEHE